MKKLLILLVLFFHLSVSAEVYDCFTFFNELELLKVRLDELDDVVDHFVLVEATKTYSGIKKPLYYAENAHEFSKYHDKIIHVVIDQFPIAEGNTLELNWPREEYSRNVILEGLVNCQENDIIFISDLDEIPCKRAVNEAKEYFRTHNLQTVNGNEHDLICELHMRLFMFYLNSESPMGWNGAVKAAPYWLVKKMLPWNVKMLHNYDRNLPKIYNAGWHLNSMGGGERLGYKHRSCASAVYLSGKETIEYWNAHIAGARIAYKCDLVPIDESYPQYIRDHLNYFKSIGWVIEKK